MNKNKRIKNKEMREQVDKRTENINTGSTAVIHIAMSLQRTKQYGTMENKKSIKKRDRTCKTEKK
jgi:hypothetical protein